MERMKEANMGPDSKLDIKHFLGLVGNFWRS